MKFQELNLSGLYLIESDCIEDEWVFFARAFCKEEFAKYGFIPFIKNNVHFGGHHSNSSFDHRSSAILRQYGPPRDGQNLTHSEVTKMNVIFDKWY